MQFCKAEMRSLKAKTGPIAIGFRLAKGESTGRSRKERYRIKSGPARLVSQPAARTYSEKWA
jgi:hypothetical protein